MPDTDADQDDAGDAEQTTSTPTTRWQYLSTVVTAFITIAYSALVLAAATGHATTIDGGTWATYSLAFLACIAYSVGVDTLNAARDTHQ